MKKLAKGGVMVAAALVLGACSDFGEDPTALAPETALERRSLVGEASAAPAPGDMTITEIVVASAEGGEFTILKAALVAAGLVDFFNGEDQYTVFAPTDAAFVSLQEELGFTSIGDMVTYLIDNDLLVPVLQYHVTEGRRAANSVVPRVGERVIETLLAGATFAVQPDRTIEDVFDGTEPKIVTPNISASNGIIHVINEVLVPIQP